MKVLFRFSVDDEDDDGLKTQANQATAHHSGRPVNPDRYRQGRRPRFNLREFEYIKEQPMKSPADESRLPERSMLAELQRRVSAEIARYRMSGLFSPKEIRTIEALWRDGLSLREHARREGVAPQAIESRIAGLKNRAVRFWTWWRLKNRVRARR